MSEESLKSAHVCRHNQTGYCKFGHNCHKKHNNEVCKETLCQDRGCLKRHPRLCRYFSSNKVCKFKENCAYVHHEKDIEIDNLENEFLTLKSEIEELKKHKQDMTEKLSKIEYPNKEIKHLREEVNVLKVTMSELKSEIMSLRPSKDEYKENTENVTADVQKYFYCDLCDSTFISKIALKKHVKIKHPISFSLQDEIKCTICDEKFWSTKEIIKHMEEHIQKQQREKPFVCKLCGLGFKNDEEIRNHMINHVERVLKEDKNEDTSAKELAKRLAVIEEDVEFQENDNESDDKDESYDDNIMLKFDEYGNFIG